mmetsp:Transcript_64090/g.139260  ORF Transcript_64090/g.139260 Transcript_64090/m.139260 type:complete len:138 (-) Transcript_64090:9-422(-)
MQAPSATHSSIHTEVASQVRQDSVPSSGAIEFNRNLLSLYVVRRIRGVVVKQLPMLGGVAINSGCAPEDNREHCKKVLSESACHPGTALLCSRSAATAEQNAHQHFFYLPRSTSTRARPMRKLSNTQASKAAALRDE